MLKTLVKTEDKDNISHQNMGENDNNDNSLYLRRQLKEDFSGEDVYKWQYFGEKNRNVHKL